MWLYILNIITIPLYALLIKNKKKFVLVVSLQLFLILALRSVTLGNDLDNYSGGFEYIGKLDFGGLMSALRPSGVASLVWPYYYENGYVALNWALSHMGWNFHGLLVVCAAINISAMGYFIYKYSKRPWLSFVILCTFGFYISMFGLLRHSLALSFCLISYCLLGNKKYTRGILAFLVALTFHRTAILFLPMLLMLIFKLKNITQKRFLYMLLLAIPLIMLSETICDTLVVGILTSMEKTSYLSVDLLMNRKIFLFIGFAIFMLVAYDFSNIKDKIDSLSCYAFIFAIYFTSIGLYNASLTRALPFYTIFLIILIPNLADQYKNQRAVAIIESAMVVGLAVYFCFAAQKALIVPYEIYQGGFLW